MPSTPNLMRGTGISRMSPRFILARKLVARLHLSLLDSFCFLPSGVALVSFYGVLYCYGPAAKHTR